MTKRTAVALSVAVICTVLAPASALCGDAVVLDTTGYWRFSFALRTPVYTDGGKITKFGSECNTGLPDPGWKKPGFDDSSWVRTPGVPFQAWSHWRKDVMANLGYVGYHMSSQAMALLCARGKFEVEDTAAAKLSLDIEYRGGAIVYVNRAEIARGHMDEAAAGPEALAEAYPADDKNRVRKLATVTIPPGALRKGVNVLAIEAHRAPYTKAAHDRMVKLRSSSYARGTFDPCGIVSIRLSGPGAKPNISRPEGLQVWNSNVLASDFDLDFGDPVEKLRPVTIVGTRNGSFSGKVVVGSTGALKSLAATMDDMKLRGGRATIPSSAVEIRYGVPTGGELYAGMRYTASASRFDGLTAEAPAEIAVAAKKSNTRNNRIPKGSPGPVFGAVAPVWITVNVPAAAVPGDYEGALTINSGGNEPVTVPVRLKVNGFTLPDLADGKTFVELIPSPETLALVYKLPLWGDKHWKLIEKSLALTGRVGTKSCYIPLICETNQGHAESMVRWIKDGDSYRHDFSIMEKYLDFVLKHQGKPWVVCIYAWDTYCNDKEVIVSSLAGGKVEPIKLPKYSDPASKALWKPVMDGVRKRLKDRGLEPAMMIGICEDTAPSDAVVDLFKEVAPGVKWVAQSHGSSGARFSKKAPLGFRADVWRLRFITHPGKSVQGWKGDKLWTHYPRDIRDNSPMTVFRLIGEMEIGGQLRGFARFGADFWSIKTGKTVTSFNYHKGGGATLADGRFPDTSWRNLNIRTALLAASPDGPIGTARLEMMREGVQECEARIFIEGALLDGKITGDLAERCRKIIDERNRAIFMGLDSHTTEGLVRKGSNYDWCCRPGLTGYLWYLASGWEDRSDALYSAAAEVAAKLGVK